MNVDNLSARIFKDAEDYARLQKKHFGPGARQEFLSAAGRAAAYLVQRNETDERSINTMEAVFERVIDEMVNAARKLRGYQDRNPGEIGEQTLRLALKKLCPIFPFC